MSDSGKLRKADVSALVRSRVRELLGASLAFRELPPGTQAGVTRNMVKVARYIISGERGDNVPGSVVLQTGSGATELVRSVDFPQFVADLIRGVFDAIVEASMRQMEAFAELLKEVAATVDQFTADTISESGARDYLVERCPALLELLTGHRPRPRRTKAETAALRDCVRRLELTSRVDPLPGELTERALLRAARRRLAMDRQQLLATMVLMGINRIVVTSGEIKPGVVFRLHGPAH